MNESVLRIYPLSDEEFHEECDVKCYFRHGLKERLGEFYYRDKPIVADKGTVVLFQYEQNLVAQAELLEVVKLETPKIWDDVEYHGYFLFDLDTVYYYKNSLSAVEFNKIYPDKILGRPTHILDDKGKNKLLLKELQKRI